MNNILRSANIIRNTSSHLALRFGSLVSLSRFRVPDSKICIQVYSFKNSNLVPGSKIRIRILGLPLGLSVSRSSILRFRSGYPVQYHAEPDPCTYLNCAMSEERHLYDLWQAGTKGMNDMLLWVKTWLWLILVDSSFYTQCT